MSEDDNTKRLLKCIQRLQELSSLSPNDQFHREFVKYINAFLKAFGNERAYVVGSTAENSKLRWSTDHGDTDYIFVSEKLVVPTKNIEYRTGNAIWIKTSDIEHKQLVDEHSYLNPKILKDVSPRLFTLLRAVYVTVTALEIFSAGKDSTAMHSKVGLAMEEYTNLQLSDNDNVRPDSNVRRDMAQGSSYEEDLKINQVDKQLLLRILRLVSSTTESPGWHGKYKPFVDIVAELIPEVEKIQSKKTSLQDFIDPDGSQYETEGGTPATYTDKSSTDFVPALKVDCTEGILPCIEKFYKRTKKASWPGEKLAEEIKGMDVFIVSRLAPVSPNENRDFGLSFNHQECLLVQNFPLGAKIIFLILKSFLKGTIRRESKLKSRLKSKLKSYHMKTLMFWMCEEEESSLWEESNRLVAVSSTLQRLRICLEDKCLQHYFMLRNLFVGFDNTDFEFLLECVEAILLNPIEHIEAFFEVDKEEKGVVFLSPEEVFSLKNVTEDEDRSQATDRLKDASVDFFRGCNESQKVLSEKNAPIKEAVLNLLDVFFYDEKTKNTKGNADCYPESNSECEARLISNLLSFFFTACKSNNINLLGCLESELPGGQQFIQTLGGEGFLQRVLQSASDPVDVRRGQLRSALQRFLDCEDENEECTSLELKQELLVHFCIQRLNIEWIRSLFPKIMVVLRLALTIGSFART